MKVRVKNDAQILVPNAEHSNFTFSGKTIEAETILSGNPVEIKGKRRGEPFVYRLFITDDKRIIYQNNIEPMKATEVTLGADAQVTPVSVNFKPAEKFSKTKTTGIVIGGIIGFAYAKYKKHDLKKVAMYIAIGSALGYAAGYVIDRNKAVTVSASK